MYEDGGATTRVYEDGGANIRVYEDGGATTKTQVVFLRGFVVADSYPF